MYKFIIVGQGLAGSAMAHTLRKHGIDQFLVVDQGIAGSSSLAAAGIFNPITGARWTKSWMADDLFPFLNNFYREAEQFLACPFLHPNGLVQLFENVEQQNFLMGKSAQEGYREYVDLAGPDFPTHVHAFGAFTIPKAGFLDVGKYISQTRQWLQNSNKLIEVSFDPALVLQTEKGIQWGNFESEKLVYCTGLGLKQLGLNFAPVLQPLKGEMLEIAVENVIENHRVLKKKVLAVPVSPHAYWVGSTYQKVFDNLDPTEQARQSLFEGFVDFWQGSATITRQWAGARPTTPDRRPYVGTLPGTDNQFILNGLGTKGVSLSPFFAEQLVQHILTGTRLPDAVNPVRFSNRK